MGGMISSPRRRPCASPSPPPPLDDGNLLSSPRQRPGATPSPPPPLDEDNLLSSPRRRPRATPSPPLPLEDDNLLSEILLRLPPHPAGLLRASLVCRRWRRLLRDPVFLPLLRAFHRTPPVLGLYRITPRAISFIPIGVAPDRVPAERFVFRDPDWILLGCRHGRVLLRSKPGWLQLLVWDPITGHSCCIRLGRLGSHVSRCHATFLGDPGSLGRLKGCSFRVAFVFTGNGRASACVYLSETGAWGRMITAAAYCRDVRVKATALAGDALYWLLYGGGILELHLGKETLTAIEPPPDAQSLYEGNVELMEAAGGALGFVGVNDYSLHLWEWDSGSEGTGKWVLSKIIDLDEFALLQGLPLMGVVMMEPPIRILAVDEGGNFAFLEMIFGIFKVDLSSELFMKVSHVELLEFARPYSSFYVAGGVGGSDGDSGTEP